MVYRPPLIKQLDGSTYAGLNCTMASAAMSIVREKKGVNPKVEGSPWYPTPSFLRRKTGDTTGGTTLPQAEKVAIANYETNLEVVFYEDWSDFRHEISTGRGAILQGSYSAFHNTKYDASGTFTGNHAVWINELRWSDKYDRWEYLLYDPLADGRRASIYRGPTWVDEGTLRKFAGQLDVNGKGARLGLGKAFAGYTRDTEDVILKSGAKYITRKVLVSKYDNINVRRKPALSSTVAYQLDKGGNFVAYQKKSDGPLTGGSRVWYGDRDGIRWSAGSNFVGG